MHLKDEEKGDRQFSIRILQFNDMEPRGKRMNIQILKTTL